MKIKEKELAKLKVEIYSETPISLIDRENKVIVDENGNSHFYDKLVIATGSRPFVPKDSNLSIPGAFTIRTKGDADSLKYFLRQKEVPTSEQHVIIVGGGLLGLELAAALKHKNHKITIIQRSSRLMERQLDLVSSNLLAKDVQERGIKIYFDNEVSTVFESDEVDGLEVTLKSGKILSGHAIVYAIGTRPNIEIGKNCGLKTGRGIIVNQYMQSSDPHIFAIGEIAEFNNQMFGITSAAEEQASVLANFISGDTGSVYEGSVLMNILKFQDLNLCSIGQIHFNENESGIEEIILMDIKKKFYKKCIVKDDYLIGAILMGDKNEFAEFKNLIDSRIELSEKRDSLLRGSSSAKQVKGKLVCSCSQVGDGNILEEIKNGCTDFQMLCQQTGAGLGCGSCKTEVRELLKNQEVAI